jgi:hypothetical protein
MADREDEALPASANDFSARQRFGARRTPASAAPPVLASDGEASESDEAEAFSAPFLAMALSRSQRAAADAPPQDAHPPEAAEEEEEDYALQIALAESLREHAAPLPAALVDSSDDSPDDDWDEEEEEEEVVDAQNLDPEQLSALFMRLAATGMLPGAALDGDEDQWRAATAALHAQLAAAGVVLPATVPRASVRHSEATERLLAQMREQRDAAEAARQAERAAAVADSRVRRSIWQEQDQAYAQSLAADALKASQLQAARDTQAAAEAEAAQSARTVAAAHTAARQVLQQAEADAAAILVGEEPDADEADVCELAVDVTALGVRLRRRFHVTAPAAQVYAAVRAQVAREAKEDQVHVAARLVRPGALQLAFGFPPFAILPETEPSLGAAGVHKRERLIARLADTA